MDTKPSNSLHTLKPEVEIKYDENVQGLTNEKLSFHPKKLGHKLFNKHPLTKTEKWIVAGEILFFLSGLGILSFFMFHSTKIHTNKVSTASVKKVAPPPPIIKSRLTGLDVTTTQATLPVTAVMIENSTDARPQSGLSEAGIIYEALAEGGVTRFMAVFEDNQPSSIGPIRSARPYYIDQALPYDAAYVHVGGSPDGLALISNLNVKNIDQFANGSSFTRIASRPAPHNVYTSVPTLISLEASVGWTESKFVGLPRKSESPSKTPTASSISLNPSYPSMTAGYTYNRATNSYDRSEAGTPMIDTANNKQLSPKVVIGLIIPWSNGTLDASGAYYTNYADIGGGKAYIFQDGIVTVGTWSKSSPSSQLLIGDANGSPMALNAGQTWFTALGVSSNITYK
jgi:hypothetical protein